MSWQKNGTDAEKDCALAFSTSGQWVHSFCSGIHFFVCEALVQGTTPPPPESFDLGCPNKYIKKGNKCYGVLQRKLTFSLAASKCSSEGAKLAEPKTVEEHQLVGEFLSSLCLDDYFWIGIQDINTENQ